MEKLITAVNKKTGKTREFPLATFETLQKLKDGKEWERVAATKPAPKESESTDAPKEDKNKK